MTLWQVTIRQAISRLLQRQKNTFVTNFVTSATNGCLFGAQRAALFRRIFYESCQNQYDTVHDSLNCQPVNPRFQLRQIGAFRSLRSDCSRVSRLRECGEQQCCKSWAMLYRPGRRGRFKLKFFPVWSFWSEIFSGRACLV